MTENTYTGTGGKEKKPMLPHSASIYFNALVLSMLDGRSERPSFVKILEQYLVLVKIFKTDEMGNTCNTNKVILLQ